MYKLITTIRPRSAYQRVRFVDGHKLMLTCTKKGLIRLHRLVVDPVKGQPLVGIERHERITDPSEQREAIERMARAGYNLAKMSDELKARALGR